MARTDVNIDRSPKAEHRIAGHVREMLRERVAEVITPGNVRGGRRDKSLAKRVDELASSMESLIMSVLRQEASAQTTAAPRRARSSRGGSLKRPVSAVSSNEISASVTLADREAIRALWLDRREVWTVGELARTLGATTAEEVTGLLPDPEDTATREDALIMATTHFFSPAQIEDALGAEFGDVVPDGRGTELIVVRVPRYLIPLLQDDAAARISWKYRRDDSVDALVTRALENCVASDAELPPLVLERATMNADEMMRAEGKPQRAGRREKYDHAWSVRQ